MAWCRDVVQEGYRRTRVSDAATEVAAECSTTVLVLCAITLWDGARGGEKVDNHEAERREGDVQLMERLIPPWMPLMPSMP